MYQYRNLTPDQQAAIVAEWQQRGFPWHGPPHLDEPGAYRLITATCYEHQHILHTPERLQWFEQDKEFRWAAGLMVGVDSITSATFFFTPGLSAKLGWRRFAA